jgi:hypothetical protein
MMLYIYTLVVESQNPSSFLIRNAKKVIWWRICGAFVAQGGPGTFACCLRIAVLFTTLILLFETSSSLILEKIKN